MSLSENAHQIDTFVNEVRLLAENQREILLGDQQSQISATQGHLLMLLAHHGPQTNTQLAHDLQVSPAAITKAIKSLQTSAPTLIVSQRDEQDARVLRWHLTEDGVQLAEQHEQAHAKTVGEYDKLLQAYSPEEQAVIGQFLQSLTQCLRTGEAKAQ